MNCSVRMVASFMNGIGTLLKKKSKLSRPETSWKIQAQIHGDADKVEPLIPEAQK